MFKIVTKLTSKQRKRTRDKIINDQHDKWFHINTIKYQCTNIIINNSIIDKRTKSITLSDN